jgi:hypothetical protein
VFGAAVQLNGSGSYDPDGDPITFEWTQISGTAVVLSDATNVAPTFTAPEVESDLTFRLVVTDSNGASGAMNVLVYVNADGTFPPFDAGSNSSSGGGGGCVAAQGGGAAVLVFGLIAAAARRRRKQ